MTQPIPTPLMDAVRAVINGPDSQLNWAKNYAKEALQIIYQHGYDSYNLYAQLLYVDSNLQSWRGEQAREAKKVIRSEIKRLRDIFWEAAE